MKRLHGYTIVLGAAALIAGCGETAASDDMGGNHQPDLAMGADMADPCNGPAYVEDVSKCSHAQTDYEPRVMMSAGDKWPACISDDGVFHPIGMGVPSSAARTMAWDQMAAMLWKNPSAPTMQSFIDARTAYLTPQGIASRVERRQDVHYDEIPGGKNGCTAMGAPEMYPDRCAGPARLVPIINDAFQKGIMQVEPRVQAARIEAALLWFFYLSTISELWTCNVDTIGDCDSMWGYYNAAGQRDQAAGVAGYVRPLGRETHDRVFDGLLAGRCWRDVDKTTIPTNRPELYKVALGQIDKAMLRGMALVLRQRIAAVPCLAGEAQKAQMAFVSLLGGWLDRAARATDPMKADALKAQWSATDPTKLDVKKAQDAIDALFACP